MNRLFTEIVLIGQSSFKCPGSRSRTVMIQNISVNISDLLQEFKYISCSSRYGLGSRKKKPSYAIEISAGGKSTVTVKRKMCL